MKTKPGGWTVATGVAVVVALGLAACSGDDGPVATAPIPTNVAAEATSSPDTTANALDISTSTPDTSATTDSIVTTDEPSTPTSTSGTAPSAPTTDPKPERLLPADLGPMTESIPFDDAPGVDTPGQFYEIYDNAFAFLPSSSDSSDPDLRPAAPDDLPIIAAYLRARTALYTQLSTFPVSADPNDQVRKAFADGGESYRQGAFERFRSEAQYLGFPFDKPDIYRPYVLKQPRSGDRAVVWDCRFTSAAALKADGSIAEPDAVPYSKAGIEAQIVQAAGAWVVESITLDDLACA